MSQARSIAVSASASLSVCRAAVSWVDAACESTLVAGCWQPTIEERISIRMKLRADMGCSFREAGNFRAEQYQNVRPPDTWRHIHRNEHTFFSCIARPAGINSYQRWWLD